MKKTFLLAGICAAMLVAAPLPGQNMISEYRVQSFQGFVRISLLTDKWPVYRTVPAFEPRQSIRGDLRVHFSHTLLHSSVIATSDSLIHIELNDSAADESVVLRVSREKPYRFNAFYYAPKKTFILDIVPERVEAPPSSLITPVEKAKRALVSRDTSEALSILQRIIAAAPMDAAANFYLGLIRLARRDLAMARQNFIRAASSDSAFFDQASEKVAAIDKQLQDAQRDVGSADTTVAGDQNAGFSYELMMTDDVPAAVNQIIADDSIDQLIENPDSADLVLVADSLRMHGAKIGGNEDEPSRAKFSNWMNAWRWSFPDYTSLFSLIARHRALLWRLSSAFAMIGVLLIAIHILSVRRSRRRKVEPSLPPKFSSLMQNASQPPPVPVFDFDEKRSARDAPFADLFKRNAKPFDLPAPLPEANDGWQGAITNLSAQELSGESLEEMAQRLKVGQGELELYMYLIKRDEASQASLSNQPRLTMAEGE